MAKLSPPTKKPVQETKPTVKQTIAKAVPKKAIEQTPPQSTKPLQLKIPESKKNEFKAYAALHGRSMSSLFLEMFDDYKEQNG